MDDGSGTTTLAFDLDALERAADPGRVFDDVRRWARNVGIVSDEPTHVETNFARKRGLDLAFHSGSYDKRESLRAIERQPEHDADRYVLIGDDDDDRRLAAEVGWEFRHVEDVAEEAGWRLREVTSPDDPDDEDSRDGWP